MQSGKKRRMDMATFLRTYKNEGATTHVHLGALSYFARTAPIVMFVC
jgi:hypothetical protein